MTKFRRKFRNVRYQNSTFKMADQDMNERKKSAKVEQRRKHVRKYLDDFYKRKKNAMEKRENSAEEKINPIGLLCHLSEKTPESEERRQRPSR